ncbi:MAG: hypothetical protein Q9215_001157 [Flavoplaca cf. flavocitrina]
MPIRQYSITLVFELISDAVEVILQRPSGAVTEMILALATLTSDYRLWMGFLIAVRDRDRGRVTYGTNDLDSAERYPNRKVGVKAKANVKASVK